MILTNVYSNISSKEMLGFREKTTLFDYSFEESILVQLYRNHGISFTYPEEWSLSEESAGSTVALTVAGPETSFWSLWLMYECPDPEQMLNSAVAAFSDDYDEVDVFQSVGQQCEYPCQECEIEFVSLELINTACLRAFQTDRFSVLILHQGTDRELDYTRKDLEAITESLECDLDDDLALGRVGVEE